MISSFAPKTGASCCNQSPSMSNKITMAERSRIMAAVKSKHTTPELVVRRLMHSLGYRYRLHSGTLPGTPDLAFPSRRKVVNVHGCFWHMHTCGRCRIPSSRRPYWIAKMQRNAARDKRIDASLRKAGWGACGMGNAKPSRPSSNAFAQGSSRSWMAI